MWQPEPGWLLVPGGTGTSTVGVWRTVLDERPVVVKRLSAPSEHDPAELSDPRHFAYWRRAADVVTSDAVLTTPGLRAPLDAAVEVRVRCAQPCHARATGRLRPGGRSFELEPISAELGSNETRTIALAIPSRARRAAKAALAKRHSVSARITVVVIVGSMSSRGRRSVKLR